MSEASRQELERQMAAFLSSGGKIEKVDAIENDKVASVAYHNASRRCYLGRMRRQRERYGRKRYSKNLAQSEKPDKSIPRFRKSALPKFGGSCPGEV